MRMLVRDSLDGALHGECYYGFAYELKYSFLTQW
jgi:hypothetical protein